MGTVIFLVVFIGGWISLAKYWMGKGRNRWLSIVGAGAISFVAGAVAGAATDGAITAPQLAQVEPALPAKPMPSTDRSPPSAPAAKPLTHAPPVASLTSAERGPSVFDRRDELETKAMAGDYQAQRNLAYSLGSEIPTEAMAACAWRIVILASGSAQVDDSDLQNKRLDCNRRLSTDALASAVARATVIAEKISDPQE